MLRSILLFALLGCCGALAGCDPPRQSAEDYLHVVSQIVAFAEDDARENAPGAPSAGALFLDVGTVVMHSRAAVGRTLHADTVEAAIDRPFRPGTLESVLLCDEEGLGGCWVREYGVFVTLNSVRGHGDQMSALVRTIMTDRRMFPTDFCNRYWSLRFERSEGAWRMVDRTLNRSCV